jgi:hypothetical protein
LKTIGRMLANRSSRPIVTTTREAWTTSPAPSLLMIGSGYENDPRQPLERDDVAFVHVRSASNNCFQCRIDRGD